MDNTTSAHYQSSCSSIRIRKRVKVQDVYSSPRPRHDLHYFMPRKPGLTPEAFKHHWETTHIPMLKQLVSHEFPLSHTRHYLESPTAVSTSDAGVSSLVGNPNGFAGVAVLTFANKEHFGRFNAKLGEKKAEWKHEEDLKRFVDVNGLKVVVVGETRATGRDGGDVGWRFVGSI